MSPTADAILTIDPPPARSMCGTTARDIRYMPLSDTSSVRSQSASSSVSTDCPPLAQYALLCNTCTAPQRSTAAATKNVRIASQADVGTHKQSLPTLRRDVRDRSFAAGGVDIAYAHRRALGGEQLAVA